MSDDVGHKGLLFALLAFQNAFITREQLLGAFSIWIADKSRSLDIVLCDQAAIDAADCELISRLVERQIAQSAGSLQQSVVALGRLATVSDELLHRAGDDADLYRTLRQAAELNPEEETVVGDCPPPAPARSSPSSLGFQILHEHARGGLGLVSLAEDLSFGRQVAFKQIRVEYADQAEYRAKFLQEAEITGQLEHPGIVPVYARGEDEFGRPFYAMRFVRGDDLKSRIAEFHRDWQMRADRFRSSEFRQMLRRYLDCCHAMSYAHDRGVLHRDLKPSNIMLGRHGETLVVDWGLAKPLGVKLNRDPQATYGVDTEMPLDTPASGSGSETRYGSLVGTPAYAPPEQLLGNLDKLGPTSDVYSLGAILYEMLTDRPPATGKTLEEVKLVVTSGAIRPPRELCSAVPPALQAVCLKALSAKQEQRYQSASELAAEIDRWLDDEPVAAYREPWVWRWSRRLRKHPRLVAGLASAVLIGAASAGIGSLLLERKNQSLRQQNIALELSRAEAQQRRLDAEQSLVNALVSESELLVRSGDRLGWSWDAIDKLTQAASVLPAQADREQLRSLWAAAEHALDFRKMDVLAEGIDCAAMSLSADGSLLAVGQRKHNLASNIYVYSTADWELKHTLTVSAADDGLKGLGDMASQLFAGGKYQEGIASLAFSPDGLWLAAGTRLGRLHTWRIDEGFEQHVTWKAFSSGEVPQLSFDASSRYLFAAGDSHSAYRCQAWQWNAGQWQPADSPLRDTAAELHCPPATDLVAALSGGEFALYRGQEFEPVKLDRIPAARSIAVSHRGDAVAIAAENGVQLFGLRGTGMTQIAATVLTSHQGVRRLRFDASDQLLAVASDEPLVTVVDTVSGSLLYRHIPLPGRSEPLVEFSPTGNWLVAAAQRGVEIYEIRRSPTGFQSIVAEGCQSVDDAAFDSQGQLKILGRIEEPNRTALQLRSYPALAQGPPGDEHSRRPVASSVTEWFPGKVLGVAGEFILGPRFLLHVPQHALLAWEAETGSWQPLGLGRATDARLFQPLPTSSSQATVTDWPELPDSRSLASAQPDADVLFGITGNGHGVRCLRLPDLAVLGDWDSEVESAITGNAEPLCLATSAGQALVGSRDGFVRVLHVDARVARRQKFANAELRSASVDDGWMAWGAFNGQVIVGTVQTLQPEIQWTAHAAPVSAVAIDGAGRWVASGSETGEIKLWVREAEVFTHLVTLPSYPSAVRHLRFDAVKHVDSAKPDSAESDLGTQRLLAVQAGSNAVRVWSIDALLRRFEARNLSPQTDPSR